MSFEWTQHRFVSGALALDVANSVILRFDAEKRLDRFADRQEIFRFGLAAQELSSEKNKFTCLDILPPQRIAPFLHLREAIDRYFRLSLENQPSTLALSDLLEQIAMTLRQAELDRTPGIDTATAQSALRLLSEPERERIKICAHCEWLFLDRSKNRSRTWCDMTVCGNRVKARLHYRKRKQEEPT